MVVAAMTAQDHKTGSSKNSEGYTQFNFKGWGPK